MTKKKPLEKKQSSKTKRELQVLLGLVDYYICHSKPVGSNTLKETGFDNLSSATIRNYFVKLEKDGFLYQPHASGGRIPTTKAYTAFAKSKREEPSLKKKLPKELEELRTLECKEIANLLEKSAEILAELTKTAVCVSSPRFDQDFIQNIKIVDIDATRCLCVIISDFGVVRSELLHIGKKLSIHSLKRIEHYFHWRLTGYDQPENMEKEEEELACKCYNEVIVRYIVNYAHFHDEEIYRTGFSRLLHYPEFAQAHDVAKVLSLFENRTSLRHLLRDCTSHKQLSYWIGNDLIPYASIKDSSGEANCSFIAQPYFIHQTCIGAVGLLGPIRMPYGDIFNILEQFSDALSEALTRNVYKFKLTYRQPHSPSYPLKLQEQHLITEKETMLLENKTKHES